MRCVNASPEDVGHWFGKKYLISWSQLRQLIWTSLTWSTVASRQSWSTSLVSKYFSPDINKIFLSPTGSCRLDQPTKYIAVYSKLFAPILMKYFSDEVLLRSEQLFWSFLLSCNTMLVAHMYHRHTFSHQSSPGSSSSWESSD